jgi:hypothetical protein
MICFPLGLIVVVILAILVAQMIGEPRVGGPAARKAARQRNQLLRSVAHLPPSQREAEIARRLQ